MAMLYSTSGGPVSASNPLTAANMPALLQLNVEEITGALIKNVVASLKKFVNQPECRQHRISMFIEWRPMLC